MKILSDDFQSHLNGEVTSICNCWIIIRKDGVRLGFTDHDQGLDLDGVVCEPFSGFEASQMEETTGLAPTNHDILGALLSDRISENDLEARKYDGARIRHYVANWSRPIEHTLMQTYLFGEIAREDGVFRAELKSLIAQLDETNLRRFEKVCSADLGDANCGIDLANGHQHSVTVERVISDDIIEVSGIDFLQPGWFSGGRVILREGTTQEQAIEISHHGRNELGKDVLTLWQAPAVSLTIEEALVVFPGCDKLLSTCQDKFGNAVNYRGFPFMPGQDFIGSYASNSEKMDGGPLVK